MASNNNISDHAINSELPLLLQNVLNADNAVRLAAEGRMEQLSQSPGFLQALAMCGTSSGVPPQLRLIALAALKQKASANAAAGELLHVLQAVLVPALRSAEAAAYPDALLRQTAAAACRVVALLDASSSTSSDGLAVFSTAVSAVSSCVADGLSNTSSARAQYQALVLISELQEALRSDSVVRADLAGSVPTLFQLIGTDATTQSVEHVRRSAMAVAVVKDIYLWSLTSTDKKSEERRQLKKVWSEQFPRLCQSLVQPYAVSFGTLPRGTDEGDSFVLHLVQHSVEMAGLVVDVLAASNWWKSCVDRGLVEAVLSALHADTGVFQQAVLSVDEEADDEEFASSLVQLFAKRWSFVEYLLRLPSLKAVLVDAVGANAGLPFVQLLATYTQLGEAELREWCEDPNAFLRHEEDREDEVGWTVRDTAAFIFQKSAKTLGPLFLGTSLEYFHGQLFSEDNDQQQWREREVALLLIELVVRERRAELRACGSADFTPLLEVILQRDACSPNPMLAARALSTLGALLHYLHKGSSSNNTSTADLSASVMAQAVASLGTDSSPLLVRAAACRLLLVLIPLCPPEALCGGYVSSGQQALCSVMQGASGELLYLALDVFTTWTCHVRKTQQQGGGVGELALLPECYSYIFNSWRRCIRDPNIGDYAVPALEECVYYASADGALVAELPWMCSVVCGQCSIAEFCATPSIIQVLCSVFRHGSEQAAQQAAQLMLDPLCHLLLSTHESGILEASSMCLVALLERCPQADRTMVVYAAPSLLRAALSPDDGEAQSSAAAESSPEDEEKRAFPLSSVFLAVVMRMLHADRQETSLFTVGKPLVTIVERAPQFTAMEVRQLIEAIVHRLASARSSIVVEQLISPLAALLRLYPSAFLDALQQCRLLEDAFRLWLPRVSALSSPAEVMRSCEGLMALLTSPEGRSLHTVSIAWQQPSVKAKASTSIPLDTAIFVCLGKSLAALLVVLSTTGTLAVDNDDDASATGLWREEGGDDGEAGWSTDDDNNDANDNDDGEGEFSRGAAAAPLPQNVAGLSVGMQQLASLFSSMQALSSSYGEAATPFFSAEELSAVMSFFSSLANAQGQ